MGDNFNGYGIHVSNIVKQNIRPPCRFSQDLKGHILQCRVYKVSCFPLIIQPS